MTTKQLFIVASIALTTSMSFAETNSQVVCSYAPSQSAAVKQIAAGLGGAGAGASAILQATGLQFVAHSGGGYILTGSGGYVAGTLLSPLVAPIVIGVTVAVGGTAIVVELSCAPRNHPEAVESIKRITADFNNALREANSKAVVVRDNTVHRVRELNENAIVSRDKAFESVKDANNRAIDVRNKFFAGVF